MITEIKTRDSSHISYNDNGEDLSLMVADVSDSDYIEIGFYSEHGITIPKSIIPELLKVLEKFR
jgi:hypothetical protein